MQLLHMDSEIKYIGRIPGVPKHTNKQLISYLILLFCVLAYGFINSSIELVSFAIGLTAANLIFRLKVFESNVIIHIENGFLSIRSKSATLWGAKLEEISSITIERKRSLLSIAREALLIKTLDDSYYIPLDGITFDNISKIQLVSELNALKHAHA